MRLAVLEDLEFSGFRSVTSLPLLSVTNGINLDQVCSYSDRLFSTRTRGLLRHSPAERFLVSAPADWRMAFVPGWKG